MKGKEISAEAVPLDKRSASGGEENETGGSANGKRSRSETSSASKHGSDSEPVAIQGIRRAIARTRKWRIWQNR